MSSSSCQTCHQVKYFKGAFQDPVNFFQIPLINAVARELSRSYVARARNSSSSSSAAVNLLSSPDAFEWSPRLVRFPHPSLQTVNLLGQVLSSFIFASLMFGSVSQVGDGWRLGASCSQDIACRTRLTVCISCGLAALEPGLTASLVLSRVVHWASCRADIRPGV